MQTKTYNVYKFDELTDEQKTKAVDNLRDINVDYEWWDGEFEDAKTIGLIITSFDLDRNRNAKGHFIESGETVAKLIQANHGAHCDTWLRANDYLSDLAKITTNCNEDENGACDDCECATEELETEFLSDLLELYSIMLQNQYEYLYSDEAIIETIQANEYDFTSDGKIA